MKLIIKFFWDTFDEDFKLFRQVIFQIIEDTKNKELCLNYVPNLINLREK